MACSWAKLEQEEPLNLNQIMQAEIIKNQQSKCLENEVSSKTKNKIPVESGRGELFHNCEDEIKMISDNTQFFQFQLDKKLLKDESKFEQISEKISLTSDTEIDDDDFDLSNQEDLDDTDDIVYKFPAVRLGEYIRKDNDLTLSDKVANHLRRFSNHKKDKQFPLNNKKDQAMTEFCRNQFIDAILNKMVNVTDIINVGKDSVIFHAKANPSYSRSLPKECVVKVYNDILLEFKQWEKYIKNDHYFMDKFNKQATSEAVIKKAQRKKDILMRLQKADVKCPRVVTLKDGVLVTSFIGKNQKPAPVLKDAVLTTEEYYKAFSQIFTSIEKMYKANLICGGISENTVLWHNKTCYFLNVSNCVERTHEQGFNMLYRNCVNLYQYFSTKNKYIFRNGGDLLFHMVWCNYEDKKAFQKLRNSFKIEN